MTKVDHGWQERGPKPHLPEPPLDDFDPMLPFKVDGTIVNRTAVARRWARAWKKEAKHCRGALEIMGEWANDDSDRIAELEEALRPLADLRRDDHWCMEECHTCAASYS